MLPASRRAEGATFWVQPLRLRRRLVQEVDEVESRRRHQSLDLLVQKEGEVGNHRRHRSRLQGRQEDLVEDHRRLQSQVHQVRTEDEVGNHRRQSLDLLVQKADVEDC